MKTLRFGIYTLMGVMLLSSCSLFKPKYGCGTNGRNVGAERATDLTKKEQRRAGKFKA